ncbi:LLM class flavin-dependent oxidoreductase [Agromyces sp. MMS24-JH15]|uniref:LLM class flavin-dependent oxidoreductase n=1 Tax=Agromyces sp. MMS24-JH15 TaxID=3243765 RepID=UPI0037499F78
MSAPNLIPRQGPLRLGFFSYASGPGTATEVYRDVTELFVASENLGLDSVWIAQHHFGSHGGQPSPLLFLASVAERTSRISLGTAVLTLPFDNALRVAEEAAIIETLYPGRLELGFGTGFGSPGLHAAFSVEADQRRPVFTEAITRIRSALAGIPLDDDGAVLYPPAPGLLDRLWEGPSQPAGVDEAARRGSGLLLSRVAIGAGATPTPEVQIPLVERHGTIVSGQGLAPRVALSRTIFPAASRAAAREALLPGFQPMMKALSDSVPELKELSYEEFLAFSNVHYGDPEDIVSSLRAEPLIDAVTELIFQVQPANPTQAETLAVIETVATEIAPRFGWAPAGSDERGWVSSRVDA